MAQAESSSLHPPHRIPWPREKLKWWDDVERPRLLRELDKRIGSLARWHKWSKRQRTSLCKDLVQAVPAKILNVETLRMRFGAGEDAMQSARDVISKILGEQAVKELDLEMLDIAATLYASQHRQDVNIFSVMTPAARTAWKSLSLRERRRARRLKARVANLEPAFLVGRPQKVDHALVAHLRHAIEKRTHRNLTRSQRTAASILTLAYKIAVPTRPVTDAAILHQLRRRKTT